MSKREWDTYIGKVNTLLSSLTTSEIYNLEKIVSGLYLSYNHTKEKGNMFSSEHFRKEISNKTAYYKQLRNLVSGALRARLKDKSEE